MGETTRSRIIGAAEALFYEHGLRSVSLDAIAERAGSVGWISLIVAGTLAALLQLTADGDKERRLQTQ